MSTCYNAVLKIRYNRFFCATPFRSDLEKPEKRVENPRNAVEQQEAHPTHCRIGRGSATQQKSASQRSQDVLIRINLALPVHDGQNWKRDPAISRSWPVFSCASRWSFAMNFTASAVLLRTKHTLSSLKILPSFSHVCVICAACALSVI